MNNPSTHLIDNKVLCGHDPDLWVMGLERVRTALDLLGNPENAFRHILVAGTNGKGSTCIYLERLFMAAGMRVGVNISPHVSRFSERFRVCGNEVDADELSRIKMHACERVSHLDLTYFEWCVVLSALVFAHKGVDTGIFEIGLGGRLDAANVMDPILCLITDISLDHTRFLGDSVGLIAREKAAIARPGRDCVTTASGSALEVIRDHCHEIGAILHEVGQFTDIHTGIQGSAQAGNAALALEGIRVLGITLTPEEINHALGTAFLPGRMEKAGDHIIMDVAHNPASMSNLAEDLSQMGFHGAAVLGILRDKDYVKMIEIISRVCAPVYIAPVAAPRSWGDKEIKECLNIPNVVQCAGIRQGLDKALGQGKNVVITGSFYSVGEVRESLISRG
ncbi:MAG: hypothetical protein U9P80_05030 [Thermodesulfobacteriota bacterium]|nr:hypothetical protein [Thermodesulfobacteriota bacterium]